MNTRVPLRDNAGLSSAITAIVVAAIPAAATIAVAAWFGNGTSTEPQLKGQVLQDSPLGSIEEFTANESGSEVTVTGSAEAGVNDVVVLVGPKSDGGFWVEKARVTDRRWDAVVKTQPRLTARYTVKAYYGHGVDLAAASEPLGFQPQPAPPPPPVNDITSCAAQYGDACFSGSQWGPPTVFQPNA